MIQLSAIVTLVFSSVISFYGIILLQKLRAKFKFEYLNSFFYYQILSLLFGLYGIIGSLIIREILPKFDIKLTGIETIALFFPLIGLPFIIAAWYMQLKIAADLCQKKTSQLIAIAYFFLTTSAFLLYGFYLVRIQNLELDVFENIRKNIFLGFALVELIVVGYIVIFLFLNALTHKTKKTRILYSQFGIILAATTLFKGLSLYFSDSHFTIGLYFLISYFAGSLPLIFLIKNYIQNNETNNVEILNHTLYLIEDYKITPREKEIIIEICKGKTNQQIADSLFITLQTVKDHIHNIFQKTQVKNRVQLSQKFSQNI